MLEVYLHVFMGWCLIKHKNFTFCLKMLSI